MDFGYVIKNNDNDFIVNYEDGVGYNVVPKDVDPYNAYDIDKVRAYCEANPDKVVAIPEPSEKELLEREKADLEAWLSAHDYIGTKIATGRATIEEYADIIAEMTEKANRINEIDELLK